MLSVTRASAGHPGGGNHAATGPVTISGPLVVGALLTADASGVSDQDGIPGGFFYQWERVHSFSPLTLSTLSGETGKTYRLTQDDVGSYIRVRAAYRDTLDNLEGVNGDTTAMVTLPPPLVLLEVNPQEFTVGQIVNSELPAATGGIKPYAYTLTGTLPAGLSFNGVTRRLSGSPTTPTTAGTPLEFTYTVTDSASPDAVVMMQEFTVTVNAAPLVLPDPDDETYTVGDTVTLTLPPATGGTGDLTYALTDSDGVMVDGFDATTRTLSGTLKARAIGVVTLTYTVTDSASPTPATETQDIMVTINPPVPAISGSSSTVTATMGIAITDITITSTGGAVDSYSIAPAIGNGLAFSTTTGTISGMPTMEASEVIYTITATNSGGTATAEVAITVTNGETASKNADNGRPVTIRTTEQDEDDSEVITEFNLDLKPVSAATIALADNPNSVTPPSGAASRSTVSLLAETVVDIQVNPDACTATAPCTVSLSYTDADLMTGASSIAPSDLYVFHFTGGKWVALPPPTLNAADKTVTASTSTFSPFGLGVLAAPSDSGGGSRPTNTAPVADAGEPQTVAGGATVSLNGRGSSDPDSDSLSYVWSQTDNDAPRVTLHGATTATPSFTAPGAAAVLEFSLTVRDRSLSSTGTVAITVQANEAPAADAGNPQTVAEGATVTLNGSGSSDSDGNSLSYAWSQTDNDAPRVTLRDADTATPSFTAPSELSAAAVLEFSLTVSDGNLSNTATVTITVTQVSEAPAADAGDPQTVDEGATVSLDGSGSSDADGDSLSYAWSQTDNGAPRVTLRGADTATPSFTAPSLLSADAVLKFSLSVSDGKLSTTATVTITVIYVNDAPDADAGAPQTVAEGATVTLSGSGTDPDGEDAALSYAWSQTDNDAPRVSLRGANTATPSFTAPSRLSAAVVLDFTLTVTDAPGATGTGQVQITVATDVAARQQALEVTLAAFGRSVATGAVDAIGHRLRPASTEVRTSSLGGSSLAACAASAPADAADTARAAGTTATPWPNPNGNDNSLTDNRAGASCRLPSRAQLAQSTFLMSLNGLSETATAGTDTEGWSLWGRGDLSRFEGRPQHEFELDGEVMAGYLGLDYRLESGGLVGLALSRSSGEIDYRSGAAEGELSIDLNTVYPYGYWSPHAGLSLWGLLGIGHGDATLTHSATAFETDLDMRMGALGGRQALHAAGGFELALKADAFMVELDSDAELGLPAVTAQASRARLMLEGRSTWQVQPDARLSTSVELGARADGGDADEGAGIEMGAGVEYGNTRLGLSAALQVQGLLAHQQSGFEEWGASLNIRLDPGVPGRGLALALTPEWGQASSGGAAQALWESDRALQNAGLAQRPSAQLDLDLSYGMNGMTQLTPFAKLALADGIARHLRMGLRVERADGLALEFFAGRNASTYSAPELLLGLSGRLRF